MSLSAYAWAKKQTVGGATAKAILMAVADYADEAGVCWPSQAQLHADTELSERAIRNGLLFLEERGFLVRERRHRDDGARAADRIVLCLSRVDQPASGAGSDAYSYRNDVPLAEPLPAPDAAPTGTSCPINRHQMPLDLPAPRAPLGPPMGDLEPSEEKETLSRPKTPKKSAVADEEFERFWRAYPKRKGSDPKKTARQSYDRAIRNGGAPGDILAAAQRYAKDRANEDPRFTAMASTWLNQERWRPDDRSGSGQGSLVDDAWEGISQKIWRLNIQMFCSSGHWPPTLGPRPSDYGYRGPPDLLNEFGFERAA